MDITDLKTEWCLLQNQLDSYEKHALYIKLLSIMVLLAAVLGNAIGLSIILILLVLWLQDAIWKTFQSRIESRLLQIEGSISEEKSGGAFQYSSNYLKTRLTGLSLINEYFIQAVRPTVAFPHVVLIVIVLVQFVLL